MTSSQQNLLVKFIEKYFEGGNDRNNVTPKVLKLILEDIRDFVTENFE